VTALPDDDSTRLVLLTLEQRSEPISGSLELQGAPPLPFHGWLELLSLLERVRGAEPLFRPPR
jgi:hypothetical protein